MSFSFIAMKSSRFFPLVLLALITTAIWWLEDMINTMQEKELHGINNHPDFYLENFILLQYNKSSNPQYRAAGQSMVRHPGNDSIEVKDINLQQLSRRHSRITVTADQALLFEDGEKIHLTGNVHIHQPRDRSNDLLDIKTETLFIDQTLNYMETSKPIILKTSKHEISGIGMQAWPDLGKYRLNSQVRGRHEP